MEVHLHSMEIISDKIYNDKMAGKTNCNTQTDRLIVDIFCTMHERIWLNIECNDRRSCLPISARKVFIFAAYSISHFKRIVCVRNVGGVPLRDARQRPQPQRIQNGKYFRTDFGCPATVCVQKEFSIHYTFCQICNVDFNVLQTSTHRFVFIAIATHSQRKKEIGFPHRDEWQKLQATCNRIPECTV